jgi:hypothetical protein
MELTYEDIVNKLRNKEPFSFSRFGDGEFNAMLGKSGQNCDGHKYFKDMGAALVNVLDEQRPDQQYYLGMQNLAKRLNGDNKAFQELTDGIDWCNADVIHYQNIKHNNLDELLDALKDRIVTLVGPLHLMELADANGWQFFKIPDKNCWIEYPTIHDYVNDSEAIEEGGVVLYCASMMANVIIDDFAIHRFSHWLTQIDIGSAFDPYVGKLSRSYHKKMKL